MSVVIYLIQVLWDAGLVLVSGLAVVVVLHHCNCSKYPVGDDVEEEDTSDDGDLYAVDSATAKLILNLMEMDNERQLG